ncbi:MAG: hypothetical protein PHY28_04595 [Dehalococcoidales bacterium]|nr:hypothetical protein [Dehalococcoidales bacterium]
MKEFYTPPWWQEYWQKRQRKRKLKKLIGLLGRPQYLISGLLLLFE